MSAPDPSSIDWTIFDGDPEGNVTCACMYADLKDGDFVPSFRSHYKFVRTETFAGVVTRKPCPKCGSHTNVSRVRGDWERG